ncbi:MAG: CpXC domain-containing protein [Oscillospiraceae bacterium]|nr:CpXC domain-containing protein [Oscillospiraceae bacterium]
MSENIMNLKCPCCNAEGRVTVPDIIDAEKSPQMAEKIFTGELFIYKCTGCGEKLRLSFPLLYINRKDKIAVQYANNEKNFKPALTVADQLKMELGDSVSVRVVCSSEDLIEKALIFRSGLDDRVIEMMKLSAYSKVKSDYPDITVNNVLFAPVKDKYGMFIRGSKNLQLLLSRDTYDRIVTDMGDILTAQDNQTYLMNEKWAAKMAHLLDLKGN